VNNQNEQYAPPTPISKRYLRWFLGFSVGVGVGLAPYLGIVKIPGFVPLLSLYPDSLRNVVIPLASILMGVIAVCIQWYAEEKVSRAKLKTWFFNSLKSFVIGFIFLIILQFSFIERIAVEAGKSWATFIVAGQRTQSCDCNNSLSDSQCIQRITFDEAEIAKCWGDRKIRFVKLSLTLVYLWTTCSFGALVGIVVLKTSPNYKKR
jgi:hypothetical protein